MNAATPILVASILLWPSAAALAANPLYLSCEFKNPTGDPQVFNFALDEAAGTFGVYVPSSGSQRTSQGVFAANIASLNEGTVAWEIDLSKGLIVRDMRMVGAKDKGVCKEISAEQSGFEP